MTFNGARIIENTAIAFETAWAHMSRIQRPFCNQIQTTRRTVKAVPTVNSFPCITYTKNAVSETKMGAHAQISEKRT